MPVLCIDCEHARVKVFRARQELVPLAMNRDELKPNEFRQLFRPTYAFRGDRDSKTPKSFLGDSPEHSNDQDCSHAVSGGQRASDCSTTTTARLQTQEES
jgi:hypothetical protein